MTNMAKYRLAGDLPANITSKLLYLVLLDITGADGKIAISQKKISEALGISHGTVSRNMHRLKDIGAIDIIPQYNDYGGRAPNKFVLWGSENEQ